ncbi:MAG: cobalamin biosynthesis protein CbiX [Thiotrichales bacterium SG8_50]|nr:MAG: cobalamin biosynthesis protein CbiX [Thiotrichales bacterium SG8_50]
MRALLVIAHGSRREASNEEVRELTKQLTKRAGQRFGFVACGFLELAAPSIKDAIDCCVANGASEILVLPYFLAAGRHVVKDIPQQVNDALADYPHVSCNTVPYLGAAPAVVDLLLAIVADDGAATPLPTGPAA